MTERVKTSNAGSLLFLVGNISMSQLILDLARRAGQLLRNIHDPSVRAEAHTFWGDVRQHLIRLQAEVASLTLIATNAESQEPTSRPDSSPSADQDRQDHNTALNTLFFTVTGDNDAIEAIWDLDPAWCRAQLAGRRILAEAGELNCWIVRTGINSSGYSRINMRNTRRPDDRTRFIGQQPFCHQLAVVAGGYGNLLITTVKVGGLDVKHEVSHLCHNKSCCNPDHVVVESQALNHARQTCHGQFIIQCSDGAVYNPCPHGFEEGRRECLLPMRKLQRGRYHYRGSGGPEVRE